MKQKLLLFSILLFFFQQNFAQLSTNPALPTATQKVTLTFDSSKESRLGFFTGELYAHTGVKIEGNNDWQHVIGTWGNNTLQPKLTHKGNGIYELEISPNINTFYAIPANEIVLQMAFVFRSADNLKQTNDLFVNVYADGLVIQFTEPTESSILEKNQAISISAKSSVEAALKLSFNNTLLTQTTGTQISANYTFTESGNFWLVAEATANSETVYDSIQVFIRNDVTTETKPAAFKKGINYLNDTSVALVLWAPLKEFVFVLGDFNNWKPSNEFQMKKDGDFFWLEIQNLEKGKEYIFQYLIDGEIRIADPYSEKIVDPWNDQYITEAIYPALIPYPENKTTGIASVFQPGQEQFSWEISDFEVPENEKLIIYELLVRDFTDEGTYKAVREKLDYLEDLNINVLELMPVNEFEGNSSWGYNPAFYFAPDKYYGHKNELKKLIDECHKRGIAVVLDMVLNHSYGQSPFVQMYMDNWTITSENPWYNEQHNFQNTGAQWGFDFNHESLATRELVDSVSAFWMSEYKIDGFRFDFTKGFSNTVYGPSSWGSNYDASRIANLKRMTDEIWKRNENAIVIFEHLAENSEETELANYGVLLWGNMHNNYLQAALGNSVNSDLTWAVFSERGWNNANIVSYPESHDEERIMYDIKRTGLATPTYNIKNQQTALDRIELNSLFHILLPGPKMIWQFEERGYDISINDFGGRLGEKPPYWQYLNNTNRTDLFKVIAKLNYLKQTNEVFSSRNFEYSLTGETKWFSFTNEENNALAIGNFGITENTVLVTFENTGKYFEFFTNDSLEINALEKSITLAPGEFRLYSSEKMEKAKVTTQTKDIQKSNNSISIYPNPATLEINIRSESSISNVQIFSMEGKLMYQSGLENRNLLKVNVNHFKPGIYFIKAFHKNELFTSKFVVN